MTLHVQIRTAGTRRRCHLCRRWIKKGKHTIGGGIVGGDQYKFVRFRNKRLCFCLHHEDLVIKNAARQFFAATDSRILLQKSPCSLTEREFCLIIGLVAMGELNPDVIARKLGRHRATILRVFRLADINNRRQTRRTVTIAAVLQLLRDHGVVQINASRVGSMLRVNPTTVGRHLGDHGLVSVGRGHTRAATVATESELLVKTD